MAAHAVMVAETLWASGHPSGMPADLRFEPVVQAFKERHSHFTGAGLHSIEPAYSAGDRACSRESTQRSRDAESVERNLRPLVGLEARAAGGRVGPCGGVRGLAAVRGGDRRARPGGGRVRGLALGRRRPARVRLPAERAVGVPLLLVCPQGRSSWSRGRGGAAARRTRSPSASHPLRMRTPPDWSQAWSNRRCFQPRRGRVRCRLVLPPTE